MRRESKAPGGHGCYEEGGGAVGRRRQDHWMQTVKELKIIPHECSPSLAHSGKKVNSSKVVVIPWNEKERETTELRIILGSNQYH